jgi:hypothetical protein
MSYTDPLIPQLPLGLNLPFAEPRDDSTNPLTLIDQLTNFDPTTLSAQSPTSDYSSIIPNLPSATKRLTKKYTNLAEQAASAGISQQAYNAVLQYDAQRVGQGAQPLSNDQTALAMAAADRQTSITQPPQKSILNVPGNAISDIAEIAQSIPKLPIALFNEVKELPNFTKRISEAQQQGANPITAIAQAPGVRLIPGSYVVGQAARGPEGLAELARHPVMTALDVLPAAGKIAEGTKVGQAAAKLSEEAGTAARPIKAVLSRTLDDSGNLVPNKVGELGQAIADTSLGQVYKQMFSKSSRDQSTMAFTANQNAMEMLHGARPPEEITSDPARQSLIYSARKANALRMEDGLAKFNIPRDQIPAVTELMTTGDWHAPNIPDNVKSFIGYANDLTRKFASELTNQELLGNFQSETYDLTTAKSLNKSQANLDSARAKVRSYSIPRLTSIANDNPRILGLIDQLEAAADPSNPATFGEANKTITNMMRQTGGNSPFSETQQASVDLVRGQVRAALAREKGFERLKTRSAPARFQPLITKGAEEATSKYFVSRGADPREVSQAIVDGNYAALDNVSLPPDVDRAPVNKVWMDAVDEITRTWQTMKAEGADPVFLHHVGANVADNLDYIKTFPGKTPLSQTKLRSATPAPFIKDITVALDHQGQEVLRRLASEDFMTKFMDTYGRSQNELIERHMPQARMMAEKQGDAQRAQSIADSLARREYTPFDASAYVNTRTTGLSSEKTWVPKHLADNIKLLYGDQDAFSKMMSPLAPVNSAFRTAVLPLSPRFHTNNFFNNIIQMGTTLDPTVFTKFGKARDLFRAVREGTDSSLGITIPDELRAELAAGVQKDLYSQQKFAAGSTFGRWWNDAQESKAVSSAQKLAGGIQKVADKSFDMFETTEGIMRSMTYLYGYDKALTKGMSADVAARAGLETSMKVIQDLSQLTPMERSIIRNVIPFYGYMQHLIRYLMNFPLDHPYRASIFSNIARMEMDDHQSALPESLRQMITVGDEDQFGNQKAINLKGLNPFSDAGDIFTFAGFVSAMNPLFKTIGQQIGLGFDGTADLHPNVHYDPSTGTMKLDAGNPLTQLLYNTIPQAQVLTELAGTNKEFGEIMRTNPQTGIRMLASQVGLPVALRTTNQRQGYIQTELSRVNDRQAVITEALKTGDDSQASLWPGLPGLLNQVRTLQTGGQLSPYAANSPSPSALQAIRGASTTNVSPNSNPLPEFAQQFAR